ncbi:MAG: hypothetical protein IPI81_05310 [Flavobacteriales bacterium]|nr:hypothetical protein [Flavobacteriales bacterium]
MDTVVVSNGAWDAIVLSLDSQNQVAWVGSLGGAQNDYPQWLTARGDELMVAVSHPWAGTYSMDSDPGVQYTPVQFDGGGVLMVKMDPYGNLLHSFPMDLDATQALRCEFLPDRSYVMTVNLYGNTLNDADPGPGTILVDSNLGQTLMLKLDSLDQLIWHKQIEGTLSQRIWDLDVLEGEKQMVITGHFWESIDLDVGEEWTCIHRTATSPFSWRDIASRTVLMTGVIQVMETELAADMQLPVPKKEVCLSEVPALAGWILTQGQIRSIRTTRFGTQYLPNTDQVLPVLNSS